MWTRPRSTIKTIVDSNPKYGVLSLVSIFMLQNLFFYANWWSLGIKTPGWALLIGAIILSPFLGMVWVYLAGWIFHFTGRWLHGRAPASYLRAALAWSKVPAGINLLMWIVLILVDWKTAFILNGKASSTFLINLVNLVTGIWSFILLIQSIREIQRFSISRSIINIAMGWVIYFLIIMIFVVLFRYIYFLSA